MASPHGHADPAATDITRVDLAELERFFDQFPGTFSWGKPKVAMIAFPRLHGHRANAPCVTRLKRMGILLLPSTFLDYDNANFRIGFGRWDMGFRSRQTDRFPGGLWRELTPGKQPVRAARSVGRTARPDRSLPSLFQRSIITIAATNRFHIDESTPCRISKKCTHQF
ncbi:MULTISPECIES: hypothetical protein [Burkholderia]|uniref:hypothetical protein n=1 Tax=Burkholderia TaxID=32008 RepID=UPI000B121814|nr:MULTISPECIES: hypothetical protein [Burkholderia]